ncbi:MAG: hypothetical protein AAF335_02415 [Bacteroidota bacterium]
MKKLFKRPTNYREKTPAVVSILIRKLKPNKTFEDFQKAHIPPGDAEKTDFGYDVDFYGVPTRVINAVSTEDPNIIYSIGLSYGNFYDILNEATKKSQEDNRSDKLEEVCDYIAKPVIAFVGSDNNYGGSNPTYEQVPLLEVTEEVTQKIESMKNNIKSQKKD